MVSTNLNKLHLLRLFILITSTIWVETFSYSQVQKNSELYRIILTNDSLLFNIGFNTCDIKQIETLLSDNFQFIHDQDSISSKQEFLNSMRNGLCSSPSYYQSKRELISESTEIYPLYSNDLLYGAVQMGNHRFYETTSTGSKVYASSAKFTHMWVVENGVWKLISALSYDHQKNDESNDPISFFNHESEIEKWLVENKIPTLGIGVIADGKLQQINVYGELRTGLSAPYNTIFNVASLTKPITAIVTLKLVSQEKWDLDEPLYKYWTDPDVEEDPNSKLLTTRHILTHQTGFTNWRGNNDDGRLRFEFTPGSKYQYSGEGFEYLRMALEKKFKKSLNTLASELIFEPLKMTDTKYFWDKKTDSLRYAVGFNTEGIPYKVIKHQTTNAADNLLTTIEDYGIFLVSLLNSEGLSPQVAQDLVTHHVKTKENKFFGLGFEIYDLGNGEYALSHGGSDQGCQTIFFLFPKTKNGLIIFTNVDDGYKVYGTLLKHYLGKHGERIVEIETD